MSHPLEDSLGRCFSAQQVADYLRCDITTVYRNYVQLGGVKYGKIYRFFEKRLIDATLQQAEKKMAGPGEAQRSTVQESFRYHEGSQKVGGKQKSSAGSRTKRASSDPHGIFG
jgi:hypothetical protein